MIPHHVEVQWFQTVKNIYIKKTADSSPFPILAIRLVAYEQVEENVGWGSIECTQQYSYRATVKRTTRCEAC